MLHICSEEQVLAEKAEKAPLLCDVCGEIYVGVHACLTKTVGKESVSGNLQDDKHTFASGNQRSKRMPPYHEIPKETLDCLAERFKEGQKYGEKSWQRMKQLTIEDDEFYTDALNHMQAHLSSLMSEDFSEDTSWQHLGAIMWGASVLAWREKHRVVPPASGYAPPTASDNSAPAGIPVYCSTDNFPDRQNPDIDLFQHDGYIKITALTRRAAELLYSDSNKKAEAREFPNIEAAVERLGPLLIEGRLGWLYTKHTK